MNSTNGSELFRPNNHSVYKIGVKEVLPSVAAGVKEVLKKHYQIIPESVKQINEWEQASNNFLITFVSGGKTNRYILRKHIDMVDRKRIDDLVRTSDYLRENDIPTPKTIDTKEGASFCVWSGNNWQLFEYMEGDHYRGTLTQLKQVASKVSLMHAALSKIPFPVKARVRSAWSKPEWQHIFEKINEGITPLDKQISDKTGYILNVIDEVNGDYNPDNYKFQPIHGDLHPQNTIFKNNHFVALIDFGDLCIAERSRDVANACHRFSRQYIVNSGTSWKKELPIAVNTFIKIYTLFNPLSEKEIKSLPTLIKDEILRKIYVDINRYLSTGSSERFEKGEFQKKMMLLEEADYIGKSIMLL